MSVPSPVIRCDACGHYRDTPNHDLGCGEPAAARRALETDRWTYHATVKDAVKRATPLMSHHQRSRIVDEVCAALAEDPTNA